ncbi:MAG: hypothetical protein AVO35_08975 [Candidatus Aegiribacteria sp. MLS_C]|nr:MAG: hypothetical protein AVO35_08975 [Candidatus Aegiribacteria sp. MLS_C]
MKFFILVLACLILTSAAFASPGSIIRSQMISGQPVNGVRGLARDWDTGRIWVAGPNSTDNTIFTSLDIESLVPDVWITAANQYWVFDIGYGYDVGGTKYILMNDQNTPFTRIVDPLDGSYEGNLPDYYSSADYTDGNAVDWVTNYVYMSSHGNDNTVYYNGSSWNTFASISGAKNMGCAVGWDHVFFIRTDPYYTIEVYETNGTYLETIPLVGYPAGQYIMGLACGRENVVGDNESLFFADFVTGQVHEVEVGDYAGTSLQHSTWGAIKAGF